MALNGNTMGDEVLAAINAINVNTYITDGVLDVEDYRTALMRAMCTAITAHITSNGVITVPVQTTDAGLQSYTVPPAAAVPTTGPIANTSLDGTIA